MKNSKGNKIGNQRNLKRVYNKSIIFKNAWKLFKEGEFETFGECLRYSWSIVKNGEVFTIESIIKKFRNELYYFIRSKVNSNEIAEEILQDVFIKANEHLVNYDVYRAKLNTWLYTIAKNSIIDYFRSKKEQYTNIESYVSDEGKEFFQVSGGTEANKLIENDELKSKIDIAFSSLKPKLREVAELYFIDQLSYDEVSERLNIPLGSVKGYINRIRTLLQEKLNKVYIEM